MNDLPRQKLVELIRQQGVNLIDDERRAAGLFLDYFGAFRRETAVLTMALEEKVPRDLLSNKNTPRGVLLAQLAQRLCDNLALNEPAAKWSVNSWALALDVISPEELTEIEAQPNPQTSTAATPANQPENPAPSPTKPQIAAPPIQPKQTQNQSAQNQSNQSPPNQPNRNQSAQNQSAQNQTSQTQTSSAAQIIVATDGSGDFATIGEAIRAARDNQKIVVRTGLYRESLIVDKPIEIAGDERAPQNAVVQSRDSNCVRLLADKAVVRNLTLHCAAGANGKQVFAVEIAGAETTLQNCDITSDSLACVAVHGEDANPLIRDCRMRDSSNTGVYFYDNAGGWMEECEIYNNLHAQIVIRENANPTIKNCRISAGKDAGFYVFENGLGTIDDCDISAHPAGEIVVSQTGSPILRGCRIHDSNGAGVFVGNRSGVLLEDCSIYNNQAAGLSVAGESIVAATNCRINRNGTVAVKVAGASSVRVMNSDLTANQLGAWDAEPNVFIENNNNRED